MSTQFHSTYEAVKQSPEYAEREEACKTLPPPLRTRILETYVKSVLLRLKIAALGL